MCIRDRSRGLNPVCYSSYVRNIIRIIRVLLTDVVSVLYLTRAVEELQSWCAHKSIQNHQKRSSIASRALNSVFYSS
eukprot:4631043-Pyramimonas_sp.AAC.1